MCRNAEGFRVHYVILFFTWENVEKVKITFTALPLNIFEQGFYCVAY